jgi:hypothetical protein
MRLDFMAIHPVSLPLSFVAKRARNLLFASGTLLAGIAASLLFVPWKRRRCIARLGGLIWKRNQFCRGWLITGDIKSSRTIPLGAACALMKRVFIGRRSPPWRDTMGVRTT